MPARTTRRKMQKSTGADTMQMFVDSCRAWYMADLRSSALACALKLVEEEVGRWPGLARPRSTSSSCSRSAPKASAGTSPMLRCAGGG